MFFCDISLFSNTVWITDFQPSVTMAGSNNEGTHPSRSFYLSSLSYKQITNTAEGHIPISFHLLPATQPWLSLD